MPKTPRTLSEFQLEFTVSFQYIEIFEQGNVSRDVPKRDGVFLACEPKSRPATGRATDTIKLNVKHSIIDQIVNRDFEYLLYQVLNV